MIKRQSYSEKIVTGPPWRASCYFDRVYCRYCRVPWCSLLLVIVKNILLPFWPIVNLDAQFPGQ